MANKVDIQLSGADFATLLGITVQRVNQLVNEGTLIRENKKYDLEVNLQLYCERLRRQAAGRLGLDTDDEDADGERFDPAREGARLKARQAEMLELKLQQARGEVMPMSDMLEVMQRIISAAKSKLMGLAASLPTQIHGLSKDEIKIIQDAVRTVLEDLTEDADAVPGQVQQMALDGD